MAKAAKAAKTTKTKRATSRSDTGGAGGTRRGSGFSLTTNAPHSTTLIISVILFLLGILGVFTYIPILTALNVWLLFAGYFLLLAGSLLKGI